MRSTIALVGAVAAVVAVDRSSQQTPQEIVTRRWTVVDEQGRPRIVAEAGPDPGLFFKSESGEDLIRLAIGGDEGDFPFDLQGVPHLTLETGQSEMTLAVMPAHEVEGLGEFPGSVSLAMNSQEWEPGQVGTAKTVILHVDTYKAGFAVSTTNADRPAGVMEPDVNVLVDATGRTQMTIREQVDDR